MMSEKPEPIETEAEKKNKSRKRQKNVANPTARKKAKTKNIARVIKIELAKPIDSIIRSKTTPTDWAKVGPELRRQRSIMHQLLNAAVCECELAQRSNVNKPVQTVAYHAVKQEFSRFVDWAANHKNKEVRDMYDGFVLPGGTLAAISGMAYKQWSIWKRDTTGKSSLPSFRKGAPIFIRKQECELTKDDEIGTHLKLKLFPNGMIRFAIRPSRGDHFKTIREIVEPDGSCWQGDCKIIFDENAHRKNGGKGKWFAYLTYYTRVPSATEPDMKKALVLNRGHHCFLYAMTTTGKSHVIVRGSDVRAYRKRISKLRGEFKGNFYEAGNGSRGHGKMRKYREYAKFGSKESNFLKTKSQQAWARVEEIMKREGCGTVIIEDYSGAETRFLKWPLFELKSYGKNMCERNGFSLQETKKVNALACPRCGSDDHKKYMNRNLIFHCNECGFERPYDFVSTFNMGLAAGADMGCFRFTPAETRTDREEKAKLKTEAAELKK